MLFGGAPVKACFAGHFADVVALGPEVVAIGLKKLGGGELALGHGLGKVGHIEIGGGGMGGVAALEKDTPDALGQFPHVTRPGVPLAG